jgi:hypothetical protein
MSGAVNLEGDAPATIVGPSPTPEPAAPAVQPELAETAAKENA